MPLMPVRSAALAALILSSAVAQGSDPASSLEWQSVRIEGMGFVTGLVVQPDPPHALFIKTDVGGAYRLDRGETRWVPLMDTLPYAERSALDIEAIAPIPGDADGVVLLAPRRHPTAVDPATGDPLFFGDILRTRDGGQTSEFLGLLDHQVRVAPNGEYRGFTGERLAVDPADEQRLIVASRLDGVWTRDETTGAWSRSTGLPAVTPWVNPDDPSDTGFAVNTPGHTFVVLDPSGGLTPAGRTRTVYVGDHATGVYRSTDGGSSFAFLPGSPAHAARATVADDGTLFVSALVSEDLGPDAGSQSGGLFRFDPASGAWADITPPSTGGPAWSGGDRPYSGVALHPTLPGRIASVAMFDGTLFVSDDRGLTWSHHAQAAIADEPSYFPPPTADNFQSRAGQWGSVVASFDPVDPDRLWVPNGFGVVRIDGVGTQAVARTWETDNLEELVMHDVVVPPVPFAEGGAAMLSACMDMVGFRHDSPDTPPTARIGTPLQIGQANGIAFSAQNPEHAVFVGWDTWRPDRMISGRTTDNGRTWTPLVTDPALGVGGRVAMSATDPDNIIWEGSFWKPLRVTLDGGASWQFARDLDAVFDPGQAGDPDYVANWWKVGWAWHVANPWWQGGHLAADAVDGGRFYRYTWGQWMSSADGGLSWSRGFSSWSVPDAPNAYCINTRLVPHPTRAGEVWIACPPNANLPDFPLYRTTDGGQTVARVPGVDRAQAVAFGKGTDPSTPWIYIVGTPTGQTAEGVWRSTDDGSSWGLVSDPADRTFNRVLTMAADLRVQGTVYVATSGRGVFVGRGTPGCGPADINSDGSLTFADVAAFVTAHSAQGATADINGNGFVNFADVQAFIAAFNAGC